MSKHLAAEFPGSEQNCPFCSWPQNTPAFPCFPRKSRYIPAHLTRKHGSQRPSGGNRAASLYGLRLVLLHTLPEEPTGEHNDGTTRFFHASAIGSWRSLRPPVASLESENVGVHFRRPQQH